MGFPHTRLLADAANMMFAILTTLKNDTKKPAPETVLARVKDIGFGTNQVIGQICYCDISQRELE